MGSLGDAYENHVLDAIFGAGYTKPATVYVALFNAAPTDAGGGTEVSGGGYARVAVTNNTTNFPAAVSGVKKNGTVITFPASTATWGSVVAWALMDASTAGNVITWGATSASVPVPVGVSPYFDVNTLVVTAD